MSKLFTRGGKILIKNGKIITGDNCCCDGKITVWKCDESSGACKSELIDDPAPAPLPDGCYLDEGICNDNCGPEENYCCDTSTGGCVLDPNGVPLSQCTANCENLTGCCCKTETIIEIDGPPPQSGSTFTQTLGVGLPYVTTITLSHDFPDNTCEDAVGTFSWNISFAPINGTTINCTSVDIRTNFGVFNNNAPSMGSISVNIPKGSCQAYTIGVSPWYNRGFGCETGTASVWDWSDNGMSVVYELCDVTTDPIQCGSLSSLSSVGGHITIGGDPQRFIEVDDEI